MSGAESAAEDSQILAVTFGLTAVTLASVNQCGLSFGNFCSGLSKKKKMKHVRRIYRLCSKMNEH